MSLFAIKSIEKIKAEAESSGEHSLKRALGPVNLVTLGIGAIIGTGIFVLTGQVAAARTGPAIILSMVIAGVVSALAGLCYSEFASSVPIAGSAYTYGYATIGEFVAWIIGWDLILEYALGAAVVAIGWSGYLVSILRDIGIQFPAALSAAPGTVVQTAEGSVTAVFNLPAVIITAIVTALLVIGIKESANVNSAIVIMKVAVIVMIIAFGAMFVNTANWHPFIPENTGNFGEYGWSGIMRGAGQIFFAYIGFDAVSTAAQEARNPQKDMPIGILGSLAICTILYVVVSAILVGMVPFKELNLPAPVAYAMEKVGAPHWVRISIDVGAVLGLGSVILVMLLGQSRVFYSMSRDGLLGKWAGAVHPKYRTPYLSTIFTGIAVSFATGLLPLQLLGQLVNIGTLLAFVLVCAGVLILRKKRPDLDRPFRTPWVPVVPILGVVCCLGLMATLPGDTWIRLIVWLLIGFVIYFGYSRKHSRLQRELGGPAGPGSAGFGGPGGRPPR
jgi:basic amino acid/polyamine antiporter, APA family